MIPCDRCGFRSKAEYRLNEMLLTFCQHHANENHAILISTGWEKFVEESLDSTEPALV